MEKNNQLKPLSIKRITELAEGNHAVVGDLERLAITALCFFDENKSTVKAFQSVGFCLLEREQELEAMQQRAEAAEVKPAELGASVPVYQYESAIYNEENGDTDWYWDDCDKGFYDQYDPSRRRILFTRPAPAADLAELVPGEMFMSDTVKANLPTEWMDGFNACRAAILRNIEEAE